MIALPKLRFWRLQLLVGTGLVGLAALAFLGTTSDIAGSLFVRTVEARQGVLETVYRGRGLIVRSEVAVQAPASGIATLLVADGQKVRAGQIVAEVREAQTPEVTAALAHIDDQIAALDRTAQRDADEMRRRIEAAERELAAAKAELAAALAAGSAGVAAELDQTVRRLSAEMDRLEQEFAALRQQRESERNALFAQREAVFREASSRAVRVVVDRPGFVVFSFDGFEGRFSPGDAPEELWQAVAETPDIHSVADGAQVRSGDTLFRLIDGFMGYVFVVFDEAPLVEQGESVRLRWPGGDPAGTPARVHSIHNRPGQVGIWFAVEVSQDPFSSVRVLPEVTVVTRRVEGIVVPRSALIMRNGRPGLYLVASGSPVFRYVTVRAVDDHQAVVDPVPAGTPVVINPRRLTRDAEPYVP
ncbi:MAG: hypothetical protein GX161_01160 [Firmicutes bacterium]|nr:hypothetical protein [Bacillota bacterium]